jgi:hypothetical protein
MTMITIPPNRYPPGSTTERRPDGRVFLWYPLGERREVTFTVPACCPTCGRPTEPTATVEEEMTI